MVQLFQLVVYIKYTYAAAHTSRHDMYVPGSTTPSTTINQHDQTHIRHTRTPNHGNCRKGHATLVKYNGQGKYRPANNCGDEIEGAHEEIGRTLLLLWGGTIIEGGD